MKKYVYIVEETEDECDSDVLIGICSTRKIAEDLAKKFNEDNDYNPEEDDSYVRVVEYELDKDCF